MAAVTICGDFGAQENKVCHCFHCLPIYFSWGDGGGLDAMMLVFWTLSFKPTFLLSSFTFIKRLFSSSSLSCQKKKIYFCFIDYAKAFDCVDRNKLENSERDGNTRLPDLPPEKSVCRSRSNRTGHGTTDWFQIRKRVHQGCILSPCLFNLHAEYIMRNARLDEAQGGIKISGRNIINLRYAEDPTLMDSLLGARNTVVKQNGKMSLLHEGNIILYVI